MLGIIIYDRETGKDYREGTTTHLTWTASTIKLAIVTELLEKQRAGSIHLSTKDRSDIADILNWSSDDAATELWHKYGDDALVPRMTSTYGMKTLTFITGFKRFWGHMKCTPEDLMHLIKYVMTKLELHPIAPTSSTPCSTSGRSSGGVSGRPVRPCTRARRTAGRSSRTTAPSTG